MLFALSIIALFIALSACIAIISFYYSDPFFYRVACSQKISYHCKKTILFLQKKAYNPLFIIWLFNELSSKVETDASNEEEATRLDLFVFVSALRIVMRVHMCTYFYIYIPLLLVLSLLGRTTTIKDWLSNLTQRFLYGIMVIKH